MEGPARILIVYAHPYPDRSRAGRALLDAVRGLPGVSTRSLYELYPDFAIDVEREQEALQGADVVVWQAPFYWYSVPALLQLWFEKVLAAGWAHGEEGRALHGKRVLWATTTGALLGAYRPGGMHGHPFEAFVTPLEQTARFCGMQWEPPFVVHGAHRIDAVELARAGEAYRDRLAALAFGDRGDR